jgi:hypothetical protein
MARKAKNEKQAAKSSPVFFKDVSTVKQYRDEKGRFISKQKAEEIGVAPVFKIVTKYRNQKGKLVSEEKVKKSKKKVVERAKVKGKLKELNREKVGKQLKEKKGEKILYKEEFWQSVRSNLQKDIQSRKTAIKANGKLYLIDKSEALIIGDFLTKLDYLILQFFDEIGESPVAFISSAFTKEKSVYDFDSFNMSENIDELEGEEDVDNALKKFNDEFNKLKNQYFRK